ncbi:5-aminolevulinate synthase [Rahnella ecdela]|jgi:5-aminolevulinate synthase|uniref:5-aminolevulinate synthase n=1 Tax=Rahnella ecdela TaxID=2816250 RepID=A0ABS6LD24_9GAMM|nr:5-aminolevulinate synthase [Rahnella ecdela]MBU9844833.1 5-aminolevulinate synthase [Rahnella ecdela]
MYDIFFREKVEILKQSGQYRNFVTLNRICGKYPLANITANHSSAVVWCSNDYLGMSQHPIVRQAVHKAVDLYGAGAGGSRNIGGNYELFEQLESSLAEWHNKEAALVFPTGFSSNDATLQCLLHLMDDVVIISDELNHASIINGIRAVNVQKEIYRHNDVKHLEEIISAYPSEMKKIIVFESVYSMDGDVSPIPEIINLAKKYNAMTFLDEVHAIGIYGNKGAGKANEMHVADQIDIIQGTMGKAIGLIGGYIASSAIVIDTIRSFATGFIFTTSLPPAVVAGCLASLNYIKDHQELRDNLHTKTMLLRFALDEMQIPVMPCSSTHVLPILIGNADKCRAAAERLLKKHHVYLQPINFPSVPVGTERFRVNATPNHTREQITHLAASLRETFEFFEIPFVTQKCKTAEII